MLIDDEFHFVSLLLITGICASVDGKTIRLADDRDEAVSSL